MRGLMRAWSLFQFELFVALLCTVTGLPLAFGIAPSPNSIAATLPTWTLFLWGVMLSVGGLCTVAGILWRHYNEQQFLAGLKVEEAGLWMLGSCSAVLAIAISAYAGSVGLLTAGIFGALAAACVSRIRTTHKEAKIVREHGQED
jgi:hypothetical protein